MPRRKLTPEEEEEASFSAETAELPDLTPQQHEFVLGLLAGKTATDAYKAAYDCSKSTPQTIYANAAKLRSNDKIALWLRMTRQAYLGVGTVTLDSHIKELERIREIALAKGNIGAAAQCEHYRGKAAGLYVEQYRDLTVDPIATLEALASKGEKAKQFAVEFAEKHNLDWKPPAPIETRH